MRIEPADVLGRHADAKRLHRLRRRQVGNAEGQRTGQQDAAKAHQ